MHDTLLFLAQDLADLHKNSISSDKAVANTLLWIAAQQTMRVGNLHVPNPSGLV